MIRQAKDAFERMAICLNNARDKMNDLISQIENLAHKYFQSVEVLMEQQLERIRKAMPKDANVDTQVKLNKLNQRVVELVESHLDWKATVPDANNVMGWLLSTMIDTFDKLQAPLTEFVGKFAKECSGWMGLFSDREIVDKIYGLYTDYCFQRCSKMYFRE